MSIDFEKARIGNSQFLLAKCVLYAGDPSFVIQYGVDYPIGLYDDEKTWYLIVFDKDIDTLNLEQDENDDHILYYRYKDEEDDKYDVFAMFEISEGDNNG